MKPALRVSLIRLCVFLLLGGITLAHFFVLRAADFVWNDSLFSAATKSDILSALAIGIRFDLSAWAYLLLVPTILLFIPLPPMWARRRFVVAGGVLIVTALPLLIMGWIDCELIRFTKARMTPATVFLFTEGEWQLKDFYHYIYLFIVAVIALTLWLVGIIKTVRWGGHKMNAENDLYHAFAPQFYRMVGLLPLLCVLVIGIRGGITHSKPIKPVDTFPELHLGNWALNTPFVFIKSMKSAKMVTPKYFDDHRQMMMLLNGADNNVSHIKAYRKENPQNIVILIMESLSLGYMGEVNHVKTYTPFLDQLAAQSLFFSNAYANANRSIDGIPAVLAALPALGAEPFLTSPYATASFEGLPATLSKHGYQSAFFHGAKRGSMFFDQFTKRAGFDVHFAREDYPNPADADTSWGIPDEPFFQFVVNQTDTLYQSGKPFMVAVFSLSAHFPFNVPEPYTKTLPQGPIKMLQSQAYADLALKRFFEAAQQKAWYPNTLFVITADHGAMQYLDEYLQDPLGEWRVPIIFYHPTIHLPKMPKEDPIQQIDILPTVLDFLNISSEKTIPLGRSVFREGERVAVIRSGKGFYTVSKNDVLYESETGDHRILLKRGTHLPADADIPQDLLLRSHAAQQYFSEAMKKRQWYP